MKVSFYCEIYDYLLFTIVIHNMNITTKRLCFTINRKKNIDNIASSFRKISWKTRVRFIWKKIFWIDSSPFDVWIIFQGWHSFSKGEKSFCSKYILSAIGANWLGKSSFWIWNSWCWISVIDCWLFKLIPYLLLLKLLNIFTLSWLLTTDCFKKECWNKPALLNCKAFDLIVKKYILPLEKRLSCESFFN